MQKIKYRAIATCCFLRNKGKLVPLYIKCPTLHYMFYIVFVFKKYLHVSPSAVQNQLKLNLNTNQM